MSYATTFLGIFTVIISILTIGAAAFLLIFGLITKRKGCWITGIALLAVMIAALMIIGIFAGAM